MATAKTSTRVSYALCMPFAMVHTHAAVINASSLAARLLTMKCVHIRIMTAGEEMRTKATATPLIALGDAWPDNIIVTGSFNSENDLV